eukprot:211100-Rhodomonas_salina.1
MRLGTCASRIASRGVCTARRAREAEVKSLANSQTVVQNQRGKRSTESSGMRGRVRVEHAIGASRVESAAVKRLSNAAPYSSSACTHGTTS